MYLRILLIIAFFLFSHLTYFAQQAGHFTLSARAGVGQSVIQSKTYGFANSSSRLSLSAGLLSDYWLTDNVSLESGFILVNKGGELAYPPGGRNANSYSVRYEMLYGEIPVTPKYTWKYKYYQLHAYIGPGLNLLFSSQTKNSSIPDNDPYAGHNGPPEQNIRKVDYSVIYGFGVNTFFLKKGHFFADIRISENINPFVSPEGDQLYNFYYSIAAGYTFR